MPSVFIKTYGCQMNERDSEAVAAQPTIGRACPELRAGYYRYPSGSHVLFYRVTSEGIDIVRVLHERIDFSRHF